MSFAVVVDSGSNITYEQSQKYNIDVVPFHYDLDGTLYPCFYENMNYEEEGHKYYELIRAGKMIKTALISIQDYIDVFRKHLEKGEDVISVSMSAKLSGTYNSSLNAKMMLEEEFPDRKIICIDAQSASFGEGIIAFKCAECRDEGLSIEETAEKVSSVRMNIRNEFVVDNLIYLRRTGRISALIYSIGALLDIKPLLRASTQADIESCGKVRGKKKALIKMVETVRDNILEPEKQTLYIAHCDVKEEAEKTAAMIKEAVPALKDICIVQYDLCSGAHVGPGAIALFYYGNKRE